MSRALIPASQLLPREGWRTVPWLQTSVSQAATFQKCQRRWYFSKRMKISEPEGAAQKLGSDIHTELEHYVNTDGLIRPGKLSEYVRLAADYLPKPPFDALRQFAERRIQLSTYPGGPYVLGFIDFTEISKTPKVVDYKTTGDIRLRAKTSAQLKTDTQMVIYAFDTLQLAETRGHAVEAVDITHLYLQTKNPKIAHPVEARLTRQEIMIGWESFKDTTREMEALSAVPDPMLIPGNFAHCGDFGGCTFRALCGTDNSEPDFSTWEKGDKMADTTEIKAGSLAERLAAKKAALEASLKPETQVKTETKVSPVVPPALTGGSESEAPRAISEADREAAEALLKLSAKGFTAAEVMQLTEEDLVQEALSGSVTPGMMRHTPMPKVKASVAKTGQVIPPDAPSRDLKVGDVGIKGEVYTGPVKTAVAPTKEVSEPTKEVTLPAEEVKTKRFRRTKAQMAADAAAGTVTKGPSKLTEEEQIRADAFDGLANAEALVALAEAEEAAKQRVAATAERLECSPEGVQAGREAMSKVAEQIIEAANSVDSPSSVGVPIVINPAKCTIYIDCIPVRGREHGLGLDADEWVYPIKTEIEQDNKWLDWRLKPYAEGKGRVVAAIRAKLHLLPEVVYVSSRSDLGQMFLEAVKPLKLNVIKGVF